MGLRQNNQHSFETDQNASIKASAVFVILLSHANVVKIKTKTTANQKGCPVSLVEWDVAIDQMNSSDTLDRTHILPLLVR